MWHQIADHAVLIGVLAFLAIAAAVICVGAGMLGDKIARDLFGRL